MNNFNQLVKLNERYGLSNLTAFRMVTSATDKKTVLGHIETDLAILNSCDVDFKWVYRVIVRENCIDICTRDNGTPVSYFFSEKALFEPKSLISDVEKICSEFKVRIEDSN